MTSRVILLIFLVQFLFPGFGNAQGYNRFGGNTNTTPKTQPAPAAATTPAPAATTTPAPAAATAPVPATATAPAPATVATPVPVINEASEWSLPPLQTLIDAALENSPLIQLANIDVKMGLYELKDVRREWLKSINLVADARYGNMVSYATASGMGVGQVSNAEMWNYGAGVSASLPLSDIIDKKRPKQKAKLKIEQAEIQKEDVIGAVKQTVIGAYYEVLSAQKTLAMNNEVSMSVTLLYEQAKLDFNTNRLSLSDFTERTEAYLNSQNTVELQKYVLMRAVRILEIIVGIELIK